MNEHCFNCGQIKEDCISTECDGNEGLSYKKCNCSRYDEKGLKILQNLDRGLITPKFSQDDYDDIGEDYDFERN